MSDDKGEGYNVQFIPDFFRELISRIIPGLVVIALCLYWSKGDFKATYSSVAISVFVIMTAWIIGVTLDVPLYVAYQSLIGVKKIKENPIAKRIILEPLDDWDVLCKATSWERGAIIKSVALTTFYRNMSAIGALTALLTHPSFGGIFPALITMFPGLFAYRLWYMILGLFCWVSFACCWYSNRKGINEHLEKLKENGRGRGHSGID